LTPSFDGNALTQRHKILPYKLESLWQPTVKISCVTFYLHRFDTATDCNTQTDVSTIAKTLEALHDVARKK